MSLRVWNVQKVWSGFPSSESSAVIGLDIMCPWCEDVCRVHPVWLRSNDHNTRPCTYCFKTAEIPEELRIQSEQET